MRYNFDDMENGLQVVNIGDVVIYHDKEYTIVHKHEGGLVNLQANFGMGFYKHDVHPNMLTIIKKSPKIKTFESFDMKIPHVVNIKKEELEKRGISDFQEWKSSPDSLYIGRNMSLYVPGATGSKWQNPFHVKEYGREECLRLYKEYILNNKELLNSLDELEGKELGCWCHPESCHGDILVDLFKKKFIEKVQIKTFEEFNAEPYAKWKNFFEVGDRVIHKDHSYSGLNIGVGTVVFKKNKENVHIDFENPTRNDCEENCCRDGHCWPTADEYAYKYEFLEPTENYYKNNIRWYHKGKLVKENYEIGDLAIYIGNQYKTRQGETVEILELDPKRTYIIYKIRFKKDGMNHIVSDSGLKEIEQIEPEPNNIKWYHKGKLVKVD